MEFLDTNILVYAVSHRADDQPKTLKARSLIHLESQVISLQVLQEFYVVCRNPRKLALSHEEATSYVKPWRRLRTIEPTLRQFDLALELCGHFPLSFYDASILAAAELAGCDILYSEDMNHGQTYGKVRVVNPFVS